MECAVLHHVTRRLKTRTTPVPGMSRVCWIHLMRRVSAFVPQTQRYPPDRHGYKGLDHDPKVKPEHFLRTLSFRKKMMLDIHHTLEVKKTCNPECSAICLCP